MIFRLLVVAVVVFSGFHQFRGAARQKTSSGACVELFMNAFQADAPAHERGQSYRFAVRPLVRNRWHGNAGRSVQEPDGDHEHHQAQKVEPSENAVRKRNRYERVEKQRESCERDRPQVLPGLCSLESDQAGGTADNKLQQNCVTTLG